MDEYAVGLFSVGTPSPMAFMLRQSLSLLFIFLVSALSAWEAASVWEVHHTPEILFVMVLALLSALRPTLAMGFFLVILPIWGGHYASKPHMVFFLQLLGALVSGLGFRWALNLIKDRSTLRLPLDNPIALAITLFVIIGLLSLVSLPLDEAITRWDQMGDQHALPFLSMKEVWVLYPALKVLLQLQSFFLFLLIINYPSAWKASITGWLFAILGSVIATLSIGLLDYYGAISLLPLRPLEDWVNPNNIQQRLQSFFGHSAWCAQYLTMAIPSVLVLLTIDMNRKVQVALMLLILVIGEYVLVLTFQRGGWVSYPLTLLVIWFCIYVLKPHQDHRPMWAHVRESARKIALSVPLTLLISLALITAVTGELPHKYLERFKAITSVGERTMYIPVALKLALLHPMLGGGSDAFAYRYVTDFLIPSGTYFNDPKPLAQFYNNAHNTYLQVLTGRGLGGLLSLLFLLFITPFMMVRHIQNGFVLKGQVLTQQQKILAMVALSSSMAYIIYGVVDDFFYIPALMILLFVVLGLTVREVPPTIKMSPSSLKAVGILLMSVLIVHLGWEFGFPGLTRKITTTSYFEGCYPPEMTPPPHSEIITWCSDRLDLELPIQTIKGKPFAFARVHPVSKSADQKRIHVKGMAEGMPFAEVELPADQDAWLVYGLDPSKAKNPTINLHLETDNGMIPLRDIRQMSLDRRRLGLMVFKDPKNPLEPMDGEASCDQGDVLDDSWEGQWCSKGGRLNLPLSILKEAGLAIRLGDDTATKENPVWVFIHTGEESLVAPISDTTWHSLSSLGLKGTPTGLQIEVSRKGLGNPRPKGQEGRITAFALGTPKKGGDGSSQNVP